VSSAGSGSGADENALEAILVSEVYPKKPIQCDEEGLRVPFHELHGESVEHLGRTGSDGIIALSNYRLYVIHKDSFINIPVGIVESVEYRDIFYMNVFCKDARTLRYSNRLREFIELQPLFADVFCLQLNGLVVSALGIQAR